MSKKINPKKKTKKQLEQEVKDLTVITTIQEDYIDLIDSKAKEFYDKHIEYAMGYWELSATYENKLEDLYKEYNEIVRAYNALATLGKFAEEQGIDIKKHNKMLPENNPDYDFKQKHTLLENGKVRHQYYLTPKDKKKKNGKDN